MTPKCQCRPGCNFAPDPGEPYRLAHDPRPEKAEARRALMTGLGRGGAASRLANRAAAKAEQAERLSLRTVEGQLQTLDRLLRNLMRSKLDAAKVASAGGVLVKIAREVLATDTIEAENRDLKALIVERMPELKKHLKAVP